MRILHYSDSTAPDFLELYKACDLLITTGDLNLSDFAGIETASPSKPAFGVYGNHDSGNYLETLSITNLHNEIIEFSGLKWGGFEGCPRYKKGPFMYSEEEAKIWAVTFPRVDVLLLHAGAQGLLDDPSDDVHTGSVHIRSYIERHEPKFVFCGHQYSNAETSVGPTQIFRTFGARIIEL